MCRIAGILSRSATPGSVSRAVELMTERMKHGGPDDKGTYVSEDGSCCLGNRRLAILDLSLSGHQPMSLGNRLHITFNGEIYNFKLIKRKLEELGHHFVTSSDTEVILKAFDQWGTDSFKMLSGMFAFALNDASTKCTYLVRDASGIKPLYYSVLQDRLVFASEVKAFYLSGERFVTDENWKIYLMAFGFIPEPFTNLKNVYSLEKGTYLVYNHQIHSYTTREYRSFNFRPLITNYDEAVSKVNEAIVGAVKSHLISDVPVGVFLSGGIDSSIITLLAYSFTKDNVNAISIDHTEEDYTERSFRQMVSDMIGNRNTEYMVTYDDFTSNFDTILASMDQPSTDGINTWFASKHAREHGLKCILSGLGADELFGGYPAFRRMGLVERLRILPKSVLRAAEKLSNVNYRRLYYLSYENMIGQYLFLRGYYTPDLIARVLDADVKEVDGLLSNFPLKSWMQQLSTGNRASWNAINIYMQNQLLKDTDYMSMSHGLEVRLPFLDQDLIDLVLNTAPEVKFNNTIPKKLLIDAFKHQLPEALWNRKKMGFTFPFQEWMKGFKRISDPSAYNNKEAKHLMTQFQAGNLHWSNAFALYHVCNG